MVGHAVQEILSSQAGNYDDNFTYLFFPQGCNTQDSAVGDRSQDTQATDNENVT